MFNQYRPVTKETWDGRLHELGRNGVLKYHSLLCDAIEIWRGRPNIAIGSHVVSAQRVHNDYQDIGSVGLRLRQLGGRPFFLQPLATLNSGK